MTTSSDPTMTADIGAETADLDRRATIENHLAHLRRQAGIFGYSIVPTTALAQMTSLSRELDGMAVGISTKRPVR